MSEEVGHGSVHVDYHTFWLSEREDPMPTPGARPSNGLVSPQPGAVEIWAGTHTGSVPVAVEVRDSAPPADDVAEWDDVVETNVQSQRGNLLVTSFFAHMPKELPNLAGSGAGLYRIRFYVRGRDSGSSYDSYAPAEEYRIISWPVKQPTPERIYKQTDAYGRALRGEDGEA
ncbi:hypothetical protein [Actinophytocola algeriensis]|uniref:Uncharacterized protein n=1 Tax=Actinophytocola algeriensis TaxID=1768010 RepID=A0A7W7VHZ6_9PSEU|nr:hypothetical protein [Actinophytocola algeriensis]MBB4910560.1 hypothetical protein [Actinophytocola algeriensis]MBE1480451.1 hypothetical protein [Actinophytocola algeriensis]